MKATENTNNMEEYKLIDLGLHSGTLWMDRNIGASSPTDSGLYFAWGETQGYTADEVGKTKNFSWADYKYANGTYNKLTKYCNDSYYGDNGYIDSLVTLQTVDDAAYQLTNGKCKMPTREQILELIDNTTYEWTTQDGVNGGLFTSKTNSNSIFIPADGYCLYGFVSGVGKSSDLWSSTLYEDNHTHATGLGFDSEAVGCYSNYKCCGFSIRCVVSNNK